MFNLEKAAEAAAYLLFKNGGSMENFKLNKLLYFAEKQSILEHGSDFTNDEMRSYKHGPVLQNSLAFFSKGPKNTYEESVWGKWFSEKSDKNIFILKNRTITAEQLEEKLSFLSYEDTDLLDSVYTKFIDIPWEKFKTLTHSKNICPEWQDPGKHPFHVINIKKLCILNGKTEKETDEILESLKLNRELSKAMREFADDRKF